MITCFLFANTLTDAGCFSLALQSNGEVAAAFMWRSIADIVKLQDNTKTVVVLSALNAAVHEVEFPWISDRKVRAAMPFVLEDMLAQPVNYLHFSFRRYKPGFYHVVILEKKILHEISFCLDKSGISYDLMTLDWCALKFGESCRIDSGILIYEDKIKGFVDQVFYNTHIFTELHEVQENGVSHHLWIARRLLDQPVFQLCQGGLKTQPSARVKVGWLYTAISLYVIWVSSVLLSMVWKTYVVHQQSQAIHHKLEDIYSHRSPKLSGRLPSNDQLMAMIRSSEINPDRIFWNLLYNLSSALQASRVIPEKITYVASTLSVSFTCRDFKTLETIQADLIKNGMHVQQKDAVSAGNHVVATLVLT